MSPEEAKLTIDYLKEMQEGYIEGEEYERHPLDEWYALDKAIEVIERTTWIPCNEDLPKDNGWYQCTVIVNDLPQTTELFYKNGKWLDNRRINMFDTYDIHGYGNTTEKHKLSYQELISEFDWTKHVVAWMPLSPSYISKRDTTEMENKI